MHTALASIPALLCLLAPAPRGQAPTPKGDTTTPAVPKKVLEAEFTPTQDEVFRHVEFLASDAMAGRRAGSEEAAKAARYVAGTFEKLGLSPAGDDDGFEQHFDRVFAYRSPSKPGEGAEWVRKKLTFRNVLAWLPGGDKAHSDEFVLVGAHFDHLGRQGDDIFNGADDNASGVAGLLAVARACARGAVLLRRSILFVAFDGEERGLQGSEYLTRNPPHPLNKLVAMINLDMIGRASFYDQERMRILKKNMRIPAGPAVGVLGTGHSPQLAAIARAVCASDELPVVAPEDFPLLQKMIERLSEGRSDHAPFERLGIPFLFFSTGESDDYHRPTDTIETVDKSTLWRIARSVYRVVLAIDALDERPSFVK